MFLGIKHKIKFNIILTFNYNKQNNTQDYNLLNLSVLLKKRR